MRSSFLAAGFFVVSLFAGWPPPASAQLAAPDTLSEEARISLITVLPGDAIYSIYGHSALRVYDPAQGLDWQYNYGTFHFDDPFFLPKFLYGKLDYFLSIARYPDALRHYRSERRPVIEQRLNLSPAQRTALFRFLQTNAQPENRYYRYDFFYDNCSTRLRDALKTTLGEALQFAPEPDPHASFRQLIDPYGPTALNLGMDLLLGIPADEVATPRQTMFLPDFLMEAFEAARVRAEDGSMRPLAAAADTVLWIDGYERPAGTGAGWTTFGWVLFALAAGVTAWSYRRGRPARRLPDALLLFAAGCAGLLIAFLMFVSAHEVTEYNLHILWAWPTHLLAAAALVRGRNTRLLRGYLGATALAALLLAAGWPLWPQGLPAPFLPLVLLFALRCGWQAYALRTASAVPASA